MAQRHHSFRSLFTTWASLALVAAFLATIPPSQAVALTPPPPEPHYVYNLGGGVYYGDLNPHGYTDVIGAGGNLAYCNVNVQKYRDDLPRWRPVWWMACAYGYPGQQEPSSLIISLPLIAFGDFPNTNNGAQDLGAFCDIPTKYTCDRSTPGVLLASNLPSVPAGAHVVPLVSSDPAPYVANSTGAYVQEVLPNDANIRHGFAYTCASCTTNTAGFPSVPSHTFAVGPPPPPNRTLTVAVEGTVSGTVTSTPAGIDCPPTCDARFDQGALVFLLETPDEGSTFDGWGGACAGSDFCFVAMSADRAVTARFSHLSTYVAMGDSFQAGVGAGDYYQDTNTDGPPPNHCKRSPHSYAKLLTTDGTVPYHLDFVACGGAVTRVIEDGTPSTDNAPYNEGAQIAHLNADTALLTIGIAGNDLDFLGVLTRCLEGGQLWFGSCESDSDADVMNRLLNLLTVDPTTGLNRLEQLYEDLEFAAPHARIVVVGYPHVFPADGAGHVCGGVMRDTDQMWMNYKISQLDRAIAASATVVGAEYVDLTNAFAGHELCNGLGNDAWLNGVVLTDAGDSYHPTANGQAAFATLIGAHLLDPPPGESLVVGQGSTQTRSVSVGAATSLSISTTWPGSDVVTSLISPSGRVVDRATAAPDVHHRVVAGRELYVVDNPEPGEWTVVLFGEDVPAGGETVTLNMASQEPPNEGPVAHFSVDQDGATITVDASPSSDSDGHVVGFLWEFGDGTFAGGPVVTHTYSQPGDYLVTLAILDDQGAMGFATAESVAHVVPPYFFSGFFPPVHNLPFLNTAQAGSTVPVKFSLGGTGSSSAIVGGYPMSQPIACDTGVVQGPPIAIALPGGSAPTYTPKQDAFLIPWKTNPDWSETCRQLVVRLTDYTKHVAKVVFR